MRLRFFDRFRRPGRSRPARGGTPGTRTGAQRPAAGSGVPAAGKHRRGDAWPARMAPAQQAGAGQPQPHQASIGSPAGQARVRPGAGGAGTPGRSGSPTRPGASGQTGASGRPGGFGRGGERAAAARVALRPDPRAADGRPAPAARPSTARPRAGTGGGQPQGAARLPWYEVAHARRAAEGRQDCGPLEEVLYREWEAGSVPPPEVTRAIGRLAELPAPVKEMLATGIDAIYVGAGGVPDLDHMGRLRGVPLPSGRATWDACAGAYGDRTIVVGSRPSAAPDVMCHEVGHALDDIGGDGGAWQSDSAEFRALYARCLPYLVSDFHRQDGELGRREFFADVFSAIASRQRPALVDMLGGHTRIALEIMLYFNVRYRI